MSLKKRYIASLCTIAACFVGSSSHAPAQTMVTSWYRAPSPSIAAHKTLPRGTVLLLNNQATGKTARVVIGDRGPFIRGRSLDVDRSVARRLGFEKRGVVPLRVRVVRTR